MVGVLKNADPRNLCLPMNNSNTIGTTTFKGKSTPRIVFLLAERGNCTFVEKARQAQLYGAEMLIITDNKAYEKPDQVIMIEDGFGDDIKIPTILIKEADGNILRAWADGQNCIYISYYLFYIYLMLLVYSYYR